LFHCGKVQLRKIKRIPFLITGAVLSFTLGLHIVSRNLVTRSQEGEQGRWRETALVERIEALTYDSRVKLGAALNDPKYVSPQMATLFFDDFAVEKVNDGSLSVYYAPATNQASAQTLYPRRWPWPRFIHGQIVRELAAQGAVAIGFDTMFSELAHDKAEERVDDPELGRLSSDEFFAAQLGRAGNVYLGAEHDNIPAPLFRTNAAAMASIVKGTDNVLRRVKPFNEVKVWNRFITEELVKPLGLQLSMAIFHSNRIVIPANVFETPGDPFVIPLNSNGSIRMTDDGQIGAIEDPADQGPMDIFPFRQIRVWNLGIMLAAKALELDLENPEFAKNQITLRGPNGVTRSIPLDDGGFFYIDWSIRFEDLKANKTPIYFGQMAPLLINDRFRQQGETNDMPFKGRIVLIGSVATGSNMADFGSTPLKSQTPLVTKHLNIANSILTGRFVERTSLAAEGLLIVVLGLISALLTWRMRVLVASIAIGGLCLCYIAFTVWMYLDYRYWIPLVMPVAGGLVLPHFALVTYRVMFEQREQRRVRGIFSKIVSPDVVQELLSAEKLSLGGARRKITVFFADVRGFTEFTDSTQQAAEDFVSKSQMSEAERHAYFDRIAAEQLATVNTYLATIADTIKHHRGTLDKYMGDCVMAFWGSPTPNQEHALCCVRAAIDSQRALYELNQQRFAENERRKKENAALAEEGGPPVPLLPLLSLGTGINTGYATVGLMGSDATILNYTVFGREVNLASRLEGASGRGRILISEATLEELRRDDPVLAATCVPQTPITPKGFRNAVRLYEVPWKTVAEPAPAVPSVAVASV
jgi:class 3 adenylate cyclase/CHASE2 domain-containing sensor protein